MWIDVQDKLFQYTSGMPLEVVNAIQSEFKVIFDSMRTSILHLLSYERIVSFATDIPNLLVSLIVFIIALFLFMLELPNLKKMLFRHLTNETAEKVRIMITRLNAVLIGFMKAQLLVSLIILAVTFIGLLLIAPKYAVVMSLIIWIIDIIPILGSIIILGSLGTLPFHKWRYSYWNTVIDTSYCTTCHSKNCRTESNGLPNWVYPLFQHSSRCSSD